MLFAQEAKLAEKQLSHVSLAHNPSSSLRLSVHCVDIFFLFAFEKVTAFGKVTA
jgi:hypothetical protein